MVHDELIVETNDAPEAHDVAIELGRLMVTGANDFLPDVPARIEPLLARCWSKKAKPTHGSDGRLVPWAAWRSARNAAGIVSFLVARVEIARTLPLLEAWLDLAENVVL
jgi:hypothetical protein